MQKYPFACYKSTEKNIVVGEPIKIPADVVSERQSKNITLMCNVISSLNSEVW